MKFSLIIIAFLTIISQFSFAQSFERKVFNYTELKDDDSTLCSAEVLDKLEQVFLTLEKHKTVEALNQSKKIFEAPEKCPRIYETYAWALFRNGNWLESIQIIDTAIIIYGANPDLIIRRAYMNFEMAELGVSARTINGKSVYLSSDKKLPFDEENFKTQNYKAALGDFQYIADNYNGRNHEIFITGYIFQKLDNDEGSNYYLSKLMNDRHYQEDASDLIVDNLIAKGRNNEAEEVLLNLSNRFPTNPGIYKKLAKMYKAAGLIEQQELALKKYEYYIWVPAYANIEYSEENYQTIRYFIKSNPVEEKQKSLKKLAKNKDGKAVDILIIILHTQANHGNGLEEEAEKILIKIGKPAVPKVIMLMNNAPSSYTIEKAAYILAEIKDPSAWQPMVNYLPKLDKTPNTTIPPNIPKQLIRFNKDKALVEILKWIKPTLSDVNIKPVNTTEEMGDKFNSDLKFGPLAVFQKHEIEKTAKGLGYSNEEVEKLLKIVALVDVQIK
ncbi:MAG: hypothetical protein H0X62_02950 [Bacteroidetes bacterium]|nr:hypothetical protein [Bacteroidota bacterium]